MNSSECSRACRLWSEAFDGRAPVPPAVAGHLADCPACQEFQARSGLLREQLAATPLPASSADQDLELLGLLRSPVAAEPRLWVRVWHALRSPAAPVLGVAGFAAFAVTLVTAHLLTVIPVGPIERSSPGAATARTVNRMPGMDPVERWLTSPQPRLIPLRRPVQEMPLPGSSVEPDAGPPRRRGDAASPTLSQLS
jgi:hypothetical protein